MSSFRSRARSYVLDALHVLIQLSENQRDEYLVSKSYWSRDGYPSALHLVELNGIEPSTSGLQSPRSPS